MAARLTTQAKCAEHFGVTTRTVRNWTSEKFDPPCPTKPRSNGAPGFHLDDVQAWLEAQGLRQPGQAKAPRATGRPSKLERAAGAASAGSAKPEPEATQEAASEPETPAALAASLRLREAEAKARLREIELAEREGALISRAEAETRIARGIEAVKVALLGAPRRYCEHLAMQGAAEIRERLDEVVREILGLFCAEVDSEQEEAA